MNLIEKTAQYYNLPPVHVTEGMVIDYLGDMEEQEEYWGAGI